jgi:hypothetical protein
MYLPEGLHRVELAAPSHRVFRGEFSVAEARADVDNSRCCKGEGRRKASEDYNYAENDVDVSSYVGVTHREGTPGPYISLQLVRILLLYLGQTSQHSP